MKMIEVQNLIYSYDQKNDALKGVSFAIEKGSYTVILGHNGSGKSTLAKLIGGLLEKKSGSIMVNGLEVNVENMRALRETIGIVFQNPDNQFIGSTVRDDIAFGLENRCVPSKDMESIIQKYSSFVHMQDYLDAEPEHLSGGQKQRVAIAGVLAMKPQVLLFDEATSMLDPVGKEEIKQLIHHLHEEDGLTIVSITHDIEEAYQADYCLVLNDGQLYCQGTPQEVFSRRAEMQKIGLDIPFINYAKALLKDKGIQVKADNSEELVEELWRLNSKK